MTQEYFCAVDDLGTLCLWIAGLFRKCTENREDCFTVLMYTCDVKRV